MNNFKTNDDLIKELLSLDEQKELQEEIEKEVKSTRGGARVGAGRKKKDSDNILQFQVRVSKREKEFLKLNGFILSPTLYYYLRFW